MAFGFAPTQGPMGSLSQHLQGLQQFGQQLAQQGQAPQSGAAANAWVPQVGAQAPAAPAAATQQQQAPTAGQQQSPFGLHLNMPQDGVNLPGYENYMPQKAAQPAAQSGSSEFGDFMNRLTNGGGHIVSTLASLFGA